MTHETSSSISVSWYTPKSIFDMLGLQFDIDVCSPPEGVPWIPTKEYFSLPQDGLTEEWRGLIWCNPPYGKESIAWLDKMNNHRNGIALVPARTGTKWFQKYAKESDAFLLLKGRIQFVDGLNKTQKGGNTVGSVLIAWGNIAVKSLYNAKEYGVFVDNTK
jgi:phage N-6-adenine-methyltransferase